MIQTLRRRFSASAKQFDTQVNYYQVLGVKKSASRKDIRQGYYAMAKKFHPDLNYAKSHSKYDEANQKFQEINMAYSILSDASLKERYDDAIGNYLANTTQETSSHTHSSNAEEAEEARTGAYYDLG